MGGGEEGRRGGGEEGRRGGGEEGRRGGGEEGRRGGDIHDYDVVNYLKCMLLRLMFMTSYALT